VTENKPLQVTWTNAADIPIPKVFWNTYNLEIPGVKICHVAQPGCESPTFIAQQHVLFLHLRPELGSERRIDDRLEVENVQVGDVAIVPACASHWNGIEQDIAEAIIITLEPQFLGQVSTELDKCDRIELLPTFAKPDPLIYGIGLTLKNTLADGICDALKEPLRDRIYFESLLNSLSIHLLRNYVTQTPVFPNYSGGLSPGKLKQAIAYIHDRLSENLSLAGIAQEVGISQYYFCRLFKQSTGLSPYQYLIQQRVERAKQLLSNPKYSIAAIALECGFTDQSSLTKHFHQRTGLTPKVYQER
jgi:AraC family transcriptional regulator